MPRAHPGRFGSWDRHWFDVLGLIALVATWGLRGGSMPALRLATHAAPSPLLTSRSGRGDPSPLVATADPDAHNAAVAPGHRPRRPRPWPATASRSDHSGRPQPPGFRCCSGTASLKPFCLRCSQPPNHRSGPSAASSVQTAPLLATPAHPAPLAASSPDRGRPRAQAPSLIRLSGRSSSALLATGPFRHRPSGMPSRLRHRLLPAVSGGGGPA